ncbi:MULTISPECIES: glycosyltransferase [unclassified Psychrobacter]|uniref:CgeB family protein n=1 Tax=unclassified Psychrobacter TaxID=196806 RepID=UPI000EC181C3|nr:MULTISPECIES: glycosyltransferase [unclassified Psychrobacter]HCI77081.1 spore coat protein [Psychrobacter sp.]
MRYLFNTSKEPRIALISDELTSLALDESSVKIFQIKNKNWFQLFKIFKPDFILVESVWRGYKDAWRYKIANYPDYPERNNIELRKLLELADKYNVPAVFWNKEDGAHFNRFIDSASLFKYILTVDSNCVERYQAILGDKVKVGVLPFAVQPKFHYPATSSPRYRKSLFIGSYSKHIHNARQQWQDMAFSAASPYGLDIIDRNSDRNPEVYRYPDLPNTTVFPNVHYNKTGDVYRQYSHCLNVNTVTDSPSMFSRRLIEIMACGRLAVSNPSVSVSTRFEGMCEVIESREHADELFAQLSKGYTKQQIEMMRYASAHVLENYNYDQWLQHIVDFIEL